MQFFDTHAHLDDAFEKGLLQAQIDAARAALVTQSVIPNCDLASLPNVLQVKSTFPHNLSAMCGLHPTYIKEDVEEQLLGLKSALFNDRQAFVAIGEIGLDLYWRKDNLAEQQRVLDTQIGWAVELGLPVALHSRDAFDPCLEILQDYKGKVCGVFHCFSGSVADAKKVMNLGFYLGIGGNITYKTNLTIETLKEMGLQSVVLETDSPYLAPGPFRGRPNQPAYIRYIAEFLALSLKVTLEEVASITTNNARTLFQLDT